MAQRNEAQKSVRATRTQTYRSSCETKSTGHSNRLSQGGEVWCSLVQSGAVGAVWWGRFYD